MREGYRTSLRVAKTFLPGDDFCHGNVMLGWWLRLNENESAELLARYSDTYFEAAALALDRFTQQAVYADDEALPILYLVSHSLELALKCAFEFRRIGLSRVSFELPPAKRTHRLTELLSAMRYACSHGQPCDFLEADTCDFVEKVDHFNVGAAFRYPYDHFDQPAWADSPIVPMGILRKEFEVHGREVQGLYYRLRDQIGD